MMRPVVMVLATGGAALTLTSAVVLWRMRPDDPRYYNATLLGGATTGGIKHLITDQGRAAALAVAGGTLPLLALILTYATGVV